MTIKQHHLLVALLFYLFPLFLFSQDEVLKYPRDVASYVNPPTYSKEVGKKYNTTLYYDHPDFGRLTFNAPYGKNVVEDLSKREIDSRYYIDVDDPTYFYIEQSTGPINFLKDGKWRAIDPALYPNGDGSYTSGLQPCMTEIDPIDQFTAFFYSNREIIMNQYQLKLIHTDGSIEIIEADWSAVAINNFGAYITDIFPFIDMRLKFGQGKIKSDLIIKQNLNVKSLEFIDNIELSENLDLLINPSVQVDQSFVEIYNTDDSETEVVIHPAVTYDHSSARESWISEFSLQGGNLHIICDSAHLNDPNIVYPITIDPTFVAVGPVNSAFGLVGSLPSPSFCSNTLNVNFPGGSTPWDVSASWEVWVDYCVGSGFGCWMSDAQLWITSGCGGASPAGAPGTIWTCLGCNSAGTWAPTLPFGSSGTQSLAQCYSPSCANQTLSFTANINRTFCSPWSVYDACDWAYSYCVSLDQWSVTVQGRSVETLGNTTTGNGTQDINDADCQGNSTLDPAALYGVPPYSYNWNTGATSATISVPNTPATYTADVTDACGTTVTATFNISCPLSVEFGEFNAQVNDRFVSLNWNTLSEDNSDYFDIQRSSDGQDWRTIGTVEAAGHSTSPLHYSFLDEHPLLGLNYYRLKQYDQDGSFDYSNIADITYSNEFKVYPNPTEGEVTIILTKEAAPNTVLIVLNPLGIELMRIPIYQLKQSVDFGELAAGNYILKLMVDEQLKESQRLSIQ
ncbi:MAG: T9SS type A sorting domain-containing protein [Crocinitomicaceae bacterium]